jgi:predicted GNAT family N-acyltransferase
VVFTLKVLSADVDLSGFDCSLDDELGLNDFIHNDAWRYQQKGMGVTYLYYRDNKIVGFITISMSSIKVSRTKVRVRGYEDDSYPALGFGRIGVANDERGNRYAGELMKYFIEFAKLKAVSEIGCRFIVLVTKQGFRVPLYKKYGFEVVEKAKLKDSSLRLMAFKLF